MEYWAIEWAGTVEKLAGALEQRILKGQFSPDSLLRESVLARRIGVSLKTMREAIRGLVPGRLVRHVPNRGFGVACLEPAEVEDLFRVREMLEIGALREHFDAARETIGRAEGILRKLARRARRRDWSGVFDEDRHFLAAFVRLHESDRLDRCFHDLFAELRLALAQVDRPVDNPDGLVAEHQKLLDPLRDGDRSATIRAFRGHLRTAARSLGDELDE